MKAFFSRLSLRPLLLTIAVAEVVMGIAYIGVAAIQAAGSTLYLIPQYILQFLHIILAAAALSAALRCADRRNMKAGVLSIVALLGAMCIKDFLGNLFSLLLGTNALLGDALLYSLQDTALYTLLFGGLFYFGVFFLGYLLFVYMRRADTIPRDPWALRGGHMLPSALYCAILVALPEWILSIVDQITYLINDVIWMPTGAEVATMLFEFFAIPAMAVIAYLVSHAILYFGMTETTVEATGA